MGSRAEAVFDGDEAYDSRQEYQRGETMLRLAEGCCHLCFRSPPEIALMYAPYGGQGVVPCCVECGASEDQDREEIELEREQNQLHRFRWGWEHHLWEDRNDTKLPRGEGRWFDEPWNAGLDAARLASDQSAESMLAAFKAWRAR
jgi:hypothetical protein